MAWPVKPSGMTWHTNRDGASVVEVDGLGVFAVLKNEDTPSKLRDAQGRPVLWPSVRKLTLGDDLVVYGCADCEYANKSENSIRPHRNKHRLGKKANGDVTAILRDAIKQIGGEQPDTSASKIEKLTADVKTWKDRALKAEKALSALRQAIAQVNDA